MKLEYLNQIKDCVLEIIDIEKIVNAIPWNSKNKYLQKYIVLKCSGAIETIFKHIIFDKLTSGSLQITSNYFENTLLKSSFNPNYENICKFIKKIDDGWSSLFKTNFNKSNMHTKRLIDLIENRNKIAHGVITTTPSILDTKNQFFSACHIITWIDANLN